MSYQFVFSSRRDNPPPLEKFRELVAPIWREGGNILAECIGSRLESISLGITNIKNGIFGNAPDNYERYLHYADIHRYSLPATEKFFGEYSYIYFSIYFGGLEDFESFESLKNGKFGIYISLHKGHIGLDKCNKPHDRDVANKVIQSIKPSIEGIISKLLLIGEFKIEYSELSWRKECFPELGTDAFHMRCLICE